MGLRAVSFGHAEERVINAAYKQLLDGSNFTRPVPIEIECAEEMLSLLDGADMVKLEKMVPMSPARTFASLEPIRGVTSSQCVPNNHFFQLMIGLLAQHRCRQAFQVRIQELTLKFNYNSIESVNELFQQYPGQITCLIMEPEKESPQTQDFLRKAQNLCRSNGTVFILDEMICGFRWHLGGGQRFHSIIPDLSTFGKAMGNGFSLSALVGKKGNHETEWAAA